MTIEAHSYKIFSVANSFTPPKIKPSAEDDYRQRSTSSPFALVLFEKCCGAHVSPREGSIVDLERLRPLTPFKTNREEFFRTIFKPVASSRAHSLDFVHRGPSMIAKPTDKGLKLLSAHYFRKYGVDIVVTGSYETFEEALKGTHVYNKSKAWGIIATNGDLLRSHVTPVICYRQSAESLIEVLQLDSLESPVLAVRETLHKMKSEEEDPLIYEVKGCRQSDSYGCRTDALVVLKDALRDLNFGSFTNLQDYLEVKKHYGPRYSFYMPGRWGKTVQMRSIMRSSDLSHMIISKKPMTVEQFWAKYEVAHDGVGVSNSFLSSKGKCYLKLIDKILDENDRDLRRRFRLLEAFYEGPQSK